MSFKIDFSKIDFKWHFNWTKSQNIVFRKIRFFLENYFSILIFSMIKNVLRFFLDTYIDVKFHALSVYEVFRAIRARQTTLWSLVRCWYQKCFFFGLNAVSGPSGRWILCITQSVALYKRTHSIVTHNFLPLVYYCRTNCHKYYQIATQLGKSIV